MPKDDVTTLVPVPIKPWTAVHSVRGKFTHMCHDGKNTLCGVRLRTMVANVAGDDEIDCHACWEALSFN